jgi:hypothetical protein
VRGECAAQRRRADRLAIPLYPRHISIMVDENLTPDEREAVVKLLRDTIAADRFPLSQRIRKLNSALSKLDPAATRVAVEPLPPPKAWINSTIGQRKRRR